MRIFLAIHFIGTRGVAGNQTWLRNLYEPLLDLGHEVYLFCNDAIASEIKYKPGTKKFKIKFSERLLEVFKKENKRPFNLFFSYLTDNYLEPSVIDEIKKFGILTCNFSCNNVHQFYLTSNIAPHFDYNLHSERDVAEKFRGIGANPLWFPMAANPKYYKPYDIPRTIDVSFVGQNYATRPYYIWHLLESRVDVHVYGPGWRKKQFQVSKLVPEWAKLNFRVAQIFFALSSEKRYHLSSRLAHRCFREHLAKKYNNNFHPPLSDEEMIRKYSESKISLGFLEVFDSHRPDAVRKLHIHLREFEAPMCRALYFTQYCDELTEFYEPDKEVVIYRNEHELLDKVRYYLNHLTEAEKVREAGYRRALACHTYHQRFNDLFKKLKLI